MPPVLADTSVWINHFRRGEPALGKLLLNGLVLTHPFVIGELACGSLGKPNARQAILNDLAALPIATVASTGEVLDLIERHKLWGRGLGWIDAHLLASALLSRSRLWTMDKALHTAASGLKLT